MKYEKLIYAILTIATIIGAVMVILHYPYGKSILRFSLVLSIIYQGWHISGLKKKIRELRVDRSI